MYCVKIKNIFFNQTIDEEHQSKIFKGCLFAYLGIIRGINQVEADQNLIVSSTKMTFERYISQMAQFIKTFSAELIGNEENVNLMLSLLG